MEAYLFALVFIGILGGIALLSYKLGCNLAFCLTVFLHGMLYMCVSIWESPLWDPSYLEHSANGWDWIFGLWILMFMVFIPLAFLLMFIYGQSRASDWKLFDWYYTKQALLYVMLLIGNWCLYSFLEDFGCYIMWDDYTVFHIFHSTFWFGIPMLYYLAIPGVILIVIALFFSRRFKK